MTAQILDFSHPLARVEKKPPPPETFDDSAIDDGMDEFRRLSAMSADERRAALKTMIDTNGAVTPFAPRDLSEMQRHGQSDEPDTVADLSLPWWVWLAAYVLALGVCLGAVIWRT